MEARFMLMSRFAGARDGSVAVIFALAMLPLLAMVGSAVDYSRASRERALMQSALDMALLAGAGSSDQVGTATKAYASERSGDKARFWVDDGGVLRGTADATVKTAVMQAVGIATMPVSVRGGASVGAGRLGNVCLLVLVPTGTGLTMNSSSTIDMPNCEVHVRSTASQGAVIVNSSSSLVTSRLCVAGQITLNSSPSRQSYKPGCQPVSDPFAGKLPVLPAAATCTHTDLALNGGSNPTIPANSVICGNLNFNGSGTVTFAPGLHRIRGTVNINSSIDVVANGVTFYLETSSSLLQMNSSTKMALTPPTSGTYAGIAMFEPPGIATASNLNLNSASDMQTNGLYYLPSRNVTLNSSSSVQARRLTMVARTAIVNSSSTWKVDLADDPTRRISVGGAMALVE
ncbi:TadE/TadG family type IV pilus assembly protein [Salinarimonas soli]|nr:TadE/TadG family type IV pilus assembly protein [Salinarimonas soli]